MQLARALATARGARPARAHSPSSATPRGRRLAARRAPTRRRPHARRAARSPTGPPLCAGGRAPLPARMMKPQAGGAPGEADPLVSNGLGSPLCSGRARRAALSRVESAQLRNVGLRRGGGADGRLRHRRAHRHRAARSELWRAAGDRAGPARHAAVDGARLGGARARRDARVVLHDRPARQRPLRGGWPAACARCRPRSRCRGWRTVLAVAAVLAPTTG